MVELLRNPCKLKRLAYGLSAILWLMAGESQALETKADYAIMLDYDTGAILYEKQSDVAMAPASMSKIMTAYIVFDALKNGSLKLDDTFYVSEKAWRKSGSRMFVEVGSQVSVKDLLKGIIVQSGNDACIVIAEGISGSEAAFAKLMNTKAQEFGLSDSHFTNASGWPDPEHKMSVRDLARISLLTIQNFPDEYFYYGMREFTYNNIRQPNRNPLLHSSIVSADGLKTGHTEASGYGLVASAARDGRRLILVINGLNSEEERRIEGEKLLGWGFSNFDNYQVFAAGDNVVTVQGWLSDPDELPLTIDQDFIVTLPRNIWPLTNIALRYPKLVVGDVAVGSPIGQIEVRKADGTVMASRPLITTASLHRLGPWAKIKAILSHLIWG